MNEDEDEVTYMIVRAVYKVPAGVYPDELFVESGLGLKDVAYVPKALLNPKGDGTFFDYEDGEEE